MHCLLLFYDDDSDFWGLGWGFGQEGEGWHWCGCFCMPCLHAFPPPTLPSLLPACLYITFFSEGRMASREEMPASWRKRDRCRQNTCNASAMPHPSCSTVSNIPSHLFAFFSQPHATCLPVAAMPKTWHAGTSQWNDSNTGLLPSFWLVWTGRRRRRRLTPDDTTDRQFPPDRTGGWLTDTWLWDFPALLPTHTHH